MNWLQRHLHWTLLIVFLLTVLLLYFTSLIEHVYAIAISFVIHYVIVTATCSWVLEQKGKSQWNLLLIILGSPTVVIACMLMKNDEEQVNMKPHMSRTSFNHLTAAETRDNTIFDKKIDINIRKTWKPLLAGILDIVSAIFSYLFALWVFYVFIMDGGLESMTVVIAYVSIASLALMGGIFALKRKNWGLALAGSIAVCAGSIYLLIRTSKSFFELPVVFAWIGIPAVILIAFSYNEFKRQ